MKQSSKKRMLVFLYMIRTRRNKSLDREREKKTDKHNLIARNKKEKQRRDLILYKKWKQKKTDLK